MTTKKDWADKKAGLMCGRYVGCTFNRCKVAYALREARNKGVEEAATFVKERFDEGLIAKEIRDLKEKI